MCPVINKITLQRNPLLHWRQMKLLKGEKYQNMHDLTKDRQVKITNLILTTNKL